MILLQLICYLFTAYFLGAIAYETYLDLKPMGYSDRWVYAKKFAAKFSQNFIYRLP